MRTCQVCGKLPCECAVVSETPAPRASQCHQCGIDFTHEPFHGTVTGVPVRTFFFCSFGCRLVWASSAHDGPETPAPAITVQELELRPRHVDVSRAPVFPRLKTPAPTGTELSAHDHGNCELCDQIEAQVATLTTERDKAIDAWDAASDRALEAEHRTNVFESVNNINRERAVNAESSLALLSAGVQQIEQEMLEDATDEYEPTRREVCLLYADRLHALTEPTP